MDSREAVSPRSFCAAIKKASEYDLMPENWQFPLHFKGIMAGVQKASEIRVNEVTEDYPWVTKVMEPCQGISVPTDTQTIIDRWKKNKIVPSLRNEQGQRLTPQHLGQNEIGLLQDLEELGIISRMGRNKERIQIPDVYRVAFGMGRKGGVPHM
jgi:hypothetical protein